MKSKIKIRTMKDDLANSNDKNEELLKEEQDQNKPNIAAVKIAGSVVASNVTSGELKDEEISELKNLIEKISENDDQKKSKEENVKEKDAAINTASEEKVSDQQEKQIDLKNDEKEELKNLIDKISETIDKKEDQPVQMESVDDKLNEEKEKKEIVIEKSKNILSEKKEAKTEVKKMEENKQSFWNDISKKLKDDKPAEPQKINEIKKKSQPLVKDIEDIKNIKKENKEEKYNNSGVLAKKEPEKKKEIRKNIYDNGDYQSPENRLIFGKQKKYSSISKRIRLKNKKDEIEDIKSAAKMKEKQKIISEKEKYKKLKNRVIRKYNVKLFLLPWKKIILMAIILIGLSGATYYVLVKKLTVPPTDPPIVISGTEIEKFNRIKNTIEFTKNDIVKMGFKENAINEKFKLNDEAEELRIIIKDNGKIVSLKEALKSARVETEDFPNDFWETTDNSYNLFAIKIREDAFRFAIAIESNDIASLLKTMGNWEQESVDKKKMFNVFEPFFTDSKTEEQINQSFKTTNYKYANIRYINLPDKDTSFDYFSSDNTLLIATSKENTNRIIDILNDGNYNYYDDYSNYESYEN